MEMNTTKLMRECHKLNISKSGCYGLHKKDIVDLIIEGEAKRAKTPNNKRKSAKRVGFAEDTKTRRRGRPQTKNATKPKKRSASNSRSRGKARGRDKVSSSRDDSPPRSRSVVSLERKRRRKKNSVDAAGLPESGSAPKNEGMSIGDEKEVETPSAVNIGDSKTAEADRSDAANQKTDDLPSSARKEKGGDALVSPEGVAFGDSNVVEQKADDLSSSEQQEATKVVFSEGRSGATSPDILARGALQETDEDRKAKRIVEGQLKKLKRSGTADLSGFLWKMLQKYGDSANAEGAGKQAEGGRVSALIEFKTTGNVPEDDKRYFNQKCPFGHDEDGNWNLYGNAAFAKIGDTPCIQCGARKARMCCLVCCVIQYGFDGVAEHGKEFVYCKECRVRNHKSLRRRREAHDIKATLIRSELVRAPFLQRDILCDLPMRAALDGLVQDIQGGAKRSYCALFVLGVGHLECWRTAIGHDATNKLVARIGAALKAQRNEVEGGKWSAKQHGQIEKVWPFRTGDDAFALALKCRDFSCRQALGPFFVALKQRIGALAADLGALVADKKAARIAAAKLQKAVDGDGRRVAMDTVALSAGLFVPSAGGKEKEWALKADKVALHRAIHCRQSIAIVYGAKLVPDGQVDGALRRSVDSVMR